MQCDSWYLLFVPIQYSPRITKTNRFEILLSYNIFINIKLGVVLRCIRIYNQFPRYQSPEAFQQLELVFSFEKRKEKKRAPHIKGHRHLESQRGFWVVSTSFRLNNSDFQTKAMALVTFGHYSNSGYRKKIWVCSARKKEEEDLFGVVPMLENCGWDFNLWKLLGDYYYDGGWRTRWNLNFGCLHPGCEKRKTIFKKKKYNLVSERS